MFHNLPAVFSSDPSGWQFCVFRCNVLFMFLFFPGVVGLQHPRVLVHRATWAESAVPGLDLWRAAQLLLDDRLLQPAGLSDSHETGTHGIRLPTCLPTAGEESRWHAEGRAGTQPHSHTQASSQPHAHTCTFLFFKWVPIYINMGEVNTTEGCNLKV